ncbi:MAG: UDP-3-O-(3-hydroxymyristoyl)glucosamine N-acyltransferase [Candidatus Saganbacteria bacterium]|nr:UDP-3-O-(3-hydroxymyristoyl)glucosamine N-acyltransferase [Candidatus Saganbacteria bacterium]
MKLKELAKLVCGKIVGNADLDVKGVSLVSEAESGDLVFVLEDKLLASAISSKASALVASSATAISGKPAIVVDDPRAAMAKILLCFAPKTPCPKGIHQTAIISKSCKIGKGVSIGAYSVLGENVSIGDNTIVYPQVYIGPKSQLGQDCIVHPQVSIYHNVIIGNRVVLHSGCRLGIDGYGYIQEKGKHVKIPQIGNVIIEDDVELYADVCVSRATLGSTVVGAGTKIDNLSHIAHNCKIGRDCAIVSLVGFAGSVTLKDHVYVAGQAGFNGHITIGENTVVMAKSGVTKDIPANSTISGFPAQDHKAEIKYRGALRRLAKKAR